jgi:peptidoglycan/xylan/chitin deacetylase (PgdA/CDA1 family)
MLAILVADAFIQLPVALYGWITGVYMLFLVYGSFFIQGKVFVRAIYKMKTDRQVIALTFDDGPDLDHTPALLKVLRKHDVKAVFFCIGKLAERHPELIRQIDAEGHVLGLHSHVHDYWYGFKTKRQVMKDLEENTEAIARIIGKRPRWFRPPYGVTNPAIGKAVASGGYQVIGWSVRSFDTILRSTALTLTRILRSISPGAVILLHDSLPHTPLVVDELIKALKLRSYQFEPLDQMIDHQPYR